jgi:prepilin-type N-terminal cleavage/methylation domain-containing protein
MKYNYHGFTLLEIMIAIGVMGVISVTIAQVFIATTKSNTKTELMKDIKQNGDYALGFITRDLQNAASVSSTCTAYPQPTALTTMNSLSYVTAEGVSAILSCDLGSGQLYRITTTSEPLTTANLTIDATCGFRCVNYADDPTKVTVQFTLKQRNTSSDVRDAAQATFTSTVSLRNR